jgi:predicted aspartyl protease
MDKWRMTSQVEKIRREIAEIQAAIRIYKSQVAHTSAQIADHEKRQIRLQEIKGELKILSGQSAVRSTD